MRKRTYFKKVLKFYRSTSKFLLNMILQRNNCVFVMATLSLGMVLGASSSYRRKTNIGDLSLSRIRHSAFEKGVQHTTYKERRLVRSVTNARKNCDSWAPWVNDNHPTQLHKDDKEVITPQTLHDFCPGGSISKFECIDDNGEAFHRNTTGDGGKFFIACYDINMGVSCTVLDPSIKHCPDVSIRYYCSCPTGLTVLASTAVVKTSVNALPTTSSGQKASQQVTTHSGSVDKRKEKEVISDETALSIGALSIPWWAFVLLVTGLSFISSTLISVCLYRKATNRLKNKFKRTVHPLQSV